MLNLPQGFVTSDAGLAEAVCKKDDEADEICLHIASELRDMLVSDPNKRTVNQVPKLLKVAEHLERVADHATNTWSRLSYLHRQESALLILTTYTEVASDD